MSITSETVTKVLTGRGTRRWPTAAPQEALGRNTQAASLPSRDRDAWHGERTAGREAGEWW